MTNVFLEQPRLRPGLLIIRSKYKLHQNVLFYSNYCKPYHKNHYKIYETSSYNNGSHHEFIDFYDKPFIFVNLLIFFCYIRSAQQHPSGQFDDWPDFQRQIIGNTPVCQGLATPDLQKVPTFPQIHIFWVRNFRKKQVNLYWFCGKSFAKSKSFDKVINSWKCNKSSLFQKVKNLHTKNPEICVIKQKFSKNFVCLC